VGKEVFAAFFIGDKAAAFVEVVMLMVLNSGSIFTWLPMMVLIHIFLEQMFAPL
jgi:hypothetical protein